MGTAGAVPARRRGGCPGNAGRFGLGAAGLRQQHGIAAARRAGRAPPEGRQDHNLPRIRRRSARGRSLPVRRASEFVGEGLVWWASLTGIWLLTLSSVTTAE